MGIGDDSDEEQPQSQSSKRKKATTPEAPAKFARTGEW